MRSILLDIIPRRFRRRSYLVSGTIFLRAQLNFAGMALLIPVLLLILDSESMHTNPWLERLYQAGGFESDRAFALTVCGCIVALIAFKNLLNLFLLRYERRYIYDLYRCMSRRLYIEYHDRGLGFIKNTNSALLSRNVNFVCLAFVTGILVPLASITSESMLLALLFTALLFYNPAVAGLVLLVFIPTVWFYYSAVRKRLHRYGVQENEAQREKARTVVETFRGYADLEINDAFPSMLRRFDRAMDKIVTIQSRNMTVNALPSIFMEVGLAIGMALFVAVSLGTPGDEARVLFGVFAVAGLRLMPSVRNMMSGWSALKYNRYTIDILRDIDLNDEKPEPSAAQPPLPFEREIAVRDLSFRFDDERGDKEVLHGLTLTIRKGEHIGIRGASGAGKTTLFNLLLGFYTPTGGEITIDGEPLTAANRRRWQNAVGYVSQHVFLLDGTLLATEDLDNRWHDLAPEYVADAVEQIRDYHVVSVAWAAYLGLGVAFCWDEDWEASAQATYQSYYGEQGFDDMDEHIVRDLLGLSLDGEEARQLEDIIRRCGQTTVGVIRHEQIEPQSPLAFHVFARACRTMFRIGVAIELKRLGYKFEKVEIGRVPGGMLS